MTAFPVTARTATPDQRADARAVVDLFCGFLEGDGMRWVMEGAACGVVIYAASQVLPPETAAMVAFLVGIYECARIIAYANQPPVLDAEVVESLSVEARPPVAAIEGGTDAK